MCICFLPVCQRNNQMKLIIAQVPLILSNDTLLLLTGLCSEQIRIFIYCFQYQSQGNIHSKLNISHQNSSILLSFLQRWIMRVPCLSHLSKLPIYLTKSTDCLSNSAWTYELLKIFGTIIRVKNKIPEKYQENSEVLAISLTGLSLLRNV